jgi:hypothetical protein
VQSIAEVHLGILRLIFNSQTDICCISNLTELETPKTYFLKTYLDTVLNQNSKLLFNTVFVPEMLTILLKQIKLFVSEGMTFMAEPLLEICTYLSMFSKEYAETVSR